MYCLAQEFKLLCLDKTILKILLVGLHEARGDPLENDKDLQNRSLGFAAYKQFIWWIFQHLDKVKRRVLSFPVQYGQIENFFEKQMDTILDLKKVKEIDQMHIQYIKLRHYSLIYSLKSFNQISLMQLHFENLDFCVSMTICLFGLSVGAIFFGRFSGNFSNGGCILYVITTAALSIMSRQCALSFLTFIGLLDHGFVIFK